MQLTIFLKRLQKLSFEGIRYLSEGSGHLSQRCSNLIQPFTLELEKGCTAPAGAAPEDDMARKEALFLKRARRFAKNDGEIDEKEQAQLEKLAEELGIPRLRMEELIEDAFDD